MKAVFKNMVTASTISGLAYTLFGLILVIWPETTSRTICYVGATVVLLMGAVGVVSYAIRSSKPVENIIRNDLATGLMLIALAIFVYIRVDLIISMIPIVLGFAIIIDGIIKLQHALDLRRMQFEGWFFVLILALFSIALGIVLLTEPFEAARTMTIMLGIGLMFSGVTSLVTTVFVRHKLKNFPSPIITIQEEEE